MSTFVETALRIFCSSNEIFDESSNYIHFEEEQVNNENRNGLNSGIIFGHIVYRTQQNEEKVSIPLVLKIMLSNRFLKDYLLVQFFNESFFWSRALPFLQKLGGSTILLPKFYDSYIHLSPQTTEILFIYEDLKAQGYRNHKRFSFLDLDHLTLMVRRLGQFHSYSYFAKYRNPKEFIALGQWFKYAEGELIWSQPNYFRLYGQFGVQRLRQDPRYSNRMAKLEKMLENADAFMLRVNTMEQEEPMSVLCHGDYLRGNVMFLYEQDNPVDMKIIDLATCRIASPVIDLSLVLYLNADRQTRSEHWNHLIDAYYEGLCQVFGGTGVPSKESILQEFTTKALNGYFIASHFLPSMIEMDRGVESFYFNYIPAEYADLPLSEMPENVFKGFVNRCCNEVGAEALADILRDMIDRNFI